MCPIFFGSMGGRHLDAPEGGRIPTADKRGYWLTAADGGVFSFGTAPFHGSMGGRRLNQPVCAGVRYGNAYLMVAGDGGIFDFSDRPFAGSLGADPPDRPVISVGAFAT